MEKSVAWIIAAAAVVIAVALSATAYQGWRATATPSLSAPYHAVVLTGGQAYFGQIDDLRSDHLVLNNVFYLQSRTNPETKQVSTTLVKRGQELHAPDRMILNKRHVMLIEPVTEGSQVAKVMAEQGKQEQGKQEQGKQK